MKKPGLDRLSEEEAARLWQRAAQLQAEAAHREDSAEEAGAESHEEEASDEGYQLEHVRTAALEAGIDAEHLDAALADIRAERTPSMRSRGGQYARWLLDDPARAITVRRVVAAAPAEVLRSMERVFPGEPYRLALRHRQGDPLDGGLLVFDIEGAGFIAQSTGDFKGQASAADLRQVLVTLQPVRDGDSKKTEVTVRGPVAWAHGINAGIGTGLVAVAGGIGLALSWPLGGWVAATLWGAGLLAPGAAAAIGAAATALGTAVTGRLGVEGLRVAYNLSLGMGRKALEALVSAVVLDAEGGWGLADGGTRHSGQLAPGDASADVSVEPTDPST
jgi:hypothetical protein